MRAKQHIVPYVIIIILSLIFTSFQWVSAQGGNAVFRTDPPTLQIGEGQVETVKIILENAQGVYGVDYQLTFDPNVVEVVDSDPDRDGIQMIPGDFIKPDFIVINLADNAAGTLHYVAAQVNPTPPAVGTGVILLVQFRGKILGGQSNLTITSAQIADQHGNKMPNEDQSGDLVIVPPKPPTPTLSLAVTPSFTPTVELITALIETPTSSSTVQNDPSSNTPENINSDRVYTAIIYAGFGGAILLIILSMRMLISKRKKTKKERSG